MVTARNTQECTKIQPDITYISYKKLETEEYRVDPLIIFTLIARQMTFAKPRHIAFKSYELSNLFVYQTCFNNLQPSFREINSKSPKMDTDSLILSSGRNDLNKDFKKLQEKYKMYEFSNLENRLGTYDETI